MTEYITKGQAVDAAYRAIHYGFNDVYKAMMEGKNLKVDADNFYYTLLENVRSEIAVAPVADVIEVVRCEDCRYYNAYVDYPMGDCMYWVIEEDLPIRLPVYGNDFCSRGKSI